jgi:hypothetical protein
VKYFVFVSMSALFLLLATPAFMAEAPCTPVFGGGQQEDGSSYCLEQVQAASNAGAPVANTGSTQPTQAPGFRTPNDSATSPLNGMTKGGISGGNKGGVYPTPTVQNQPNTGPEMLGLVALLPAAFAGWKLRKSASK